MAKLNGILLGILILLAVVVTILSTGAVRSVHSGFMSIVSPFLNAGKAATQQLGSVGAGLKTLEQIDAENRQLTIENRELRATVQILHDLEAENNRLRDSLGYVERSKFRLVPAQVISRDASTWWSMVRINRGFEDGVEVDRPIITDKGLVGKTVSVSKNISTVMLISDENCKVGAKVEGSREQGITQGRRISSDSKGEIELNFLTKQADLQPGVEVFSAGVTGAVFPPGLKLGAVKSFRQRDLDGQALVEPSVDLSTIRDVFVIVSEK